MKSKKCLLNSARKENKQTHCLKKGPARHVVNLLNMKQKKNASNKIYCTYYAV